MQLTPIVKPMIYNTTFQHALLNVTCLTVTIASFTSLSYTYTLLLLFMI